MATFPTPSQIAAQYLSFLKSVKPAINTNDVNSDFVIRGNVFSGIASGLYGDQQKVYNDNFISSARPEALSLHGQDYDITQQPATAATTTLGVTITGTNGTVVNPGDLTFLYAPTNVLYSNTTGGTIASGSLAVSAQCESVGAIGNITAPDTFQIVSPPTGVNSTASITISLANGSDLESTDSYRARILSRLQNPPAGGNETDYPAFAFDADPTVRTATIQRFARGLGTVDITITVGSTDIDDAVTNGITINPIPSSTVISNVQAYYDAHVPLTDCPLVIAPSEVSVNASIKVILATGLSLTSVPSSPTYNPLSLNVQQLVEREVSRVLYKYSVGGRVLPGGTQGYVVASDIEFSVLTWLSAVQDSTTGISQGYIPILSDVEVLPLNGSEYDLPIAANVLPMPGTITVTQVTSI